MENTQEEDRSPELRTEMATLLTMCQEVLPTLEGDDKEFAAKVATFIDFQLSKD